MRSRGKAFWSAVILLVVAAATVGLAVSLNIVRTEGWDGLWNRKKGFLEKTHPEAGPLIEEAEKRAHENQGEVEKTNPRNRKTP